MTDRIRKLLIGVILPALIGLAGVGLIVVSLPDLPDPVAIHWGATGEPDGFGPAWLNAVLLVVFIAFYCVLAMIVARGDDGFSLTQRLLLATSPFFAILLVTVLSGSLLLQRGLAEASEAPSVVPLIIAGTVAGLIAGAVSWLILPKPSAAAALESELPTLTLGATERAVWIGYAGPSGLLAVFVGGTLAFVTIVAIVVLALSAPPVVAVLFGGLLVLVSLLVASTVYWRVRLTSEGFVARSALGIPRFAIALADVDQARVVSISPVRDFGGWGMRWGGNGRFGIVTRTGEALEVRRSDGKSLVVTVDGASNAAALLNALRERLYA